MEKPMEDQINTGRNETTPAVRDEISIAQNHKVFLAGIKKRMIIDLKYLCVCVCCLCGCSDVLPFLYLTTTLIYFNLQLRSFH